MRGLLGWGRDCWDGRGLVGWGEGLLGWGVGGGTVGMGEGLLGWWRRDCWEGGGTGGMGSRDCCDGGDCWDGEEGLLRLGGGWTVERGEGRTVGRRL